jgi:transcriptional regulator with XRE-family HTH domain
MIDYTAMGKRIRKYREAREWYQSDLAEAVRMSNTTISHIEVGKGKPELNTVVNIANALNVTVDMLLCDSLEKSDAIFKKEFSDLVLDCSAAELRLILDVVNPLLEAFRRAKDSRQNG